jgi:hypothetical protein
MLIHHSSQVSFVLDKVEPFPNVESCPKKAKHAWMTDSCLRKDPHFAVQAGNALLVEQSCRNNLHHNGKRSFSGMLARGAVAWLKVAFTT